MKTFLSRWFVVLLAVALSTACSDNDEEPPVTIQGTGITAPGWNDTNSADAKGGTLIYPFTAAAQWQAASDSDWCVLLTENGAAGECSMRLSLKVNTSDTPRTATVTLHCTGYDTPATFTIIQKEAYQEQGDGRFKEVNEWMYSYMESHYLWNEPIPSLPLDYSLDYQSFLTSMLDGIASHDDVNHEDGIWQGGKRISYYTFVQSGAPVGTSTLAAGQVMNGTGILLMQPTNLPGGVVGLTLKAVTPGSPAADAGLRRGDFISKVNGTPLTATNYEQLGQLVYNGPATVTPNDIVWEGGQFQLFERPEVTLSAGRYTDPAIYKQDVITLGDDRKVGYLVYMGFHCDYDQELIDVFDRFKSEGISDLILDLRYNNGGDVLACDVLATLVAGQRHKGEILSRFLYNATRTAAGESAELRIGEKVCVSAPGGYQPIEDALAHSVNLQTVYVICSSVTASASEMFINGLRGLDIDVRTVGTTTNGKNVGMEGISKMFHSYEFAFYPVSFYTENAKGFKDYSDGLVPDLLIDDKGYYPGEFGTTDDTLCGATLSWIITGSKPAVSAVSAPMATPLGDMVSPGMASRPGGCLVHPVQP